MKTQYMHFRPANVQMNPRGGLTVAIRAIDPITRNSAHAVPGKVVVAISRCSKDDVFNRKLGRKIADGRMNAWFECKYPNGKSPNIIEVEVPELADESCYREAVAQALYRNDIHV